MLLCLIFHQSLGIAYSSFLLGCFHPHSFLILLHHRARSRCLDIKVIPDTTVYPLPETTAIIKCASSIYVAVLMPYLIFKMQVKCFSGRNICCYGKTTTIGEPIRVCLLPNVIILSCWITQSAWDVPLLDKVSCQNTLSTLSVQNDCLTRDIVTDNNTATLYHTKNSLHLPGLCFTG